MTANVFIATCDPENFDETVLREVDLTEVKECPEELRDLEAVRFWGAREGERNRQYFEKMQRGDLVLFYQDGMYVGTGFVGRTFEDEERWAASTFWRNAPSKLVYTIDEFAALDIPRAKVNKLFGYGSEYYPQGLTRVADDRVSKDGNVIRRALVMYDEKH